MSGGDQIHFPALCVSGNLLNATNSLDGITVCTRAGFRSDYYKGLVLIDFHGNRYEVIGARKLRTLFRSAGDIFSLMVGNPLWQVELVFAPNPRPPSFDEIKKLIVDSFKKETSWDAMIDFDEFRDRVSAAASLEQVFRVFREFNQL